MATTVTAVSVVPFDDNSPRYKCCCGCCHVRCGAFVIACMQTFGLASLLFNSGKAANGFRQGVNGTAYIPTVINTVFFILCVLAVVCLFIGLCKERPNYLTPMLAVLVASICYYLLMAIFVVVAYATNSDLLVDFLSQQMQMQGNTHNIEQVKKSLNFALIVIVITFLIGALFDFWWYRVIKCCRTYLQDKEAWKMYHPGSQYAVTAATGANDVNCVLITHPVPSSYQPQAGAYGYPPAFPAQSHYSGAPIVSAEHQFMNPPPTYTDAMSMDKSRPSAPPAN